MKKKLIKITTISLITIVGFNLNACKKVKRETSEYSQQDEYYEMDNQEPKNNIDTISSIDDKEFVLIYYHFPSQLCQSTKLKESLAEQYKATDIATEVSNNNVTCETYGKNSNSNGCISDDTNYNIGTSCTIGINILSAKNREEKINKMIFLENIQESIISQFY